MCHCCIVFSCTYKHFQDATISLVWLLPILLTSVTNLAKGDLPLEATKEEDIESSNYWGQVEKQDFQYSNFDSLSYKKKKISDNRYHFKTIEKIQGEKRISAIDGTIKTTKMFNQLYNRILCPTCIARQGIIQGVVVSNYINYDRNTLIENIFVVRSIFFLIQFYTIFSL